LVWRLKNKSKWKLIKVISPQSQTRFGFLLWGILILFSFEACIGEQNNSIVELFQKAVEIPYRKDVELVIKGYSEVPRSHRAAALMQYEEIREAIIARVDEAMPFLKHICDTSSNWKELTTANAMLGWINYPELYAELWDWHAPRNALRNPYHLMRGQARAKFSQAGKKSVPIMLELLWKKGEAHFGVLPELLFEWSIESSIPVIVESISIYGPLGYRDEVVASLGSFGNKATPYILDELKESDESRSAFFIKALGYTGDKQAVPELIHFIKEGGSKNICELAAKSLCQLGEFGVLREQVKNIDDPHTIIAVLDALAQDKSEENQDFLYKYATEYENPNEWIYRAVRLSATKALLHNATAQNIATVCKLTPKEPHDYTRSGIYLFLGQKKDKRVRKALLKALEDESAWVRISAIDGLGRYDDQEVTRALLAIVKAYNSMNNKDDLETACVKEAIYVLKDRESPSIGLAAVGLLRIDNSYVQQYASEALEKNPTDGAVEPLINILSSDNNGVKLRALQALREYRSKAIGKEMIRFLASEDDSIVSCALQNLTNNPTKEAIQPMIGCLDSENIGVRYHAVKALVKTKGNGTLAAFKTALKLSLIHI